MNRSFRWVSRKVWPFNLLPRFPILPILVLTDLTDYEQHSDLN